MDIRNLEEADLPAVLELCRRSLPLDEFELTPLRRRLIEEPNRNPSYQLCLWDDARLVGVMFGGTRRLHDGHTLLPHERAVGILQLFAVDPDYRRRGLAGRMLTTLGQRMHGRGLSWLRCGNFAPSYFWPGVDLRYTPGLCFLLRHGFHRKGDAVNMEVDLTAHDWDTSAAEARLAADGFSIRRLLPGDQAALSEWVHAEWGSIWQWEALSTYANDPVSAFVALKEGKLCAFACYDTSSFRNVFGPTGTAEDQRWKGLGRVLLLRCLRDLRELGFERAEISWVGPISFYARTVDAAINRSFYWLEKEL
ncbi:N-acetyltransferase family protein [Kouleothrix sp.]|uniref:GNAT family N-acetyltransferase n=1 Tax=Kouleothrix sp. TaxID=2779161 RepID=UPI00391D01B8